MLKGAEVATRGVDISTDGTSEEAPKRALSGLVPGQAGLEQAFGGQRLGQSHSFHQIRTVHCRVLDLRCGQVSSACELHESREVASKMSRLG